MKIVSLGSALAAIARAMRRFSSASCSSRLRKESSWPASSGSTAPPCVRRSRPSCARIARSRRAVMPEMPNARSTVATVTLPRSPSIARIRRLRSSGMTGGGPSGGLCSSIVVPIYRAWRAAERAARRACTGRHVCATSRSHMFESTPLAPDTTVSDHQNDHSGDAAPRRAPQRVGIARAATCSMRIARRKEARPPSSRS